MATTIGRTYTSPQGAIAQLNQNVAKARGTTISAPQVPIGQQMAQATPTTDQTTPPPQTPPVGTPAPSPMNLIPYGSPQGGTEDIDALAKVRAQMIDELFNHDQNISQQYYGTPESPAYIADPMKRAQVAGMKEQADLGLLSTINNLLSSRKSELGKAGTPSAKKEYYTQQLTDALIQDQGQTPIADIVKTFRGYLPINDIVDTYQTMNPNQPVHVSDLLTYGYKLPSNVTTANEKVKKAQLALRAIDDLDKASKEANQWYSAMNMIPGVSDLLAGFDPTASYQNEKSAMSQKLVKLMMDSNYPGVAENIEKRVPEAWSREDIRAEHIASLKKDMMNIIDNEQNSAPQFALGYSPNDDIASDYDSTFGKTTVQAQPNTAQAPQYGITPITTSTGKTYTVERGGL